jgi:DNA modification methylase
MTQCCTLYVMCCQYNVYAIYHVRSLTQSETIISSKFKYIYIYELFLLCLICKERGGLHTQVNNFLPIHIVYTTSESPWSYFHATWINMKKSYKKKEIWSLPPHKFPLLQSHSGWASSSEMKKKEWNNS